MTHFGTEQKSIRQGETKISYDEFLRKYSDGEHLEWVNGKVIPKSPVTWGHEDVRLFLLTLLREYVLLKDLGTVSGEPYNMKIGHGFPGRSPDVMFVAKANRARIRQEYLDGPADLVGEILSTKTRRIDREVKFAEYDSGGVKEY